MVGMIMCRKEHTLNLAKAMRYLVFLSPKAMCFFSFFLSLQTSYDVFIICALLSFLVHGIYPIILLKKWPVNSLTENR
jgi:hypothetical protein